MKLTKRTLGIACAVVAAAVMTFTGCDGFGKDDFYGTWESHYTIPDHNKTSGAEGWYSDQANCNVDLTMYFSGTSEDLINKGAVFYQDKIRYKSDGSGDVVKETFWYGTYKLEDNAAYDKGNLVLSYKFGFTLGTAGKLELTADKEVTVKEKKGDVVYILKSGTYDANVLSQIALGNATTDYIVQKADDKTTCSNPDNAMFIAYSGLKAEDREVRSELHSSGDKNLCSDVERFTFELGDADFFRGYTTMTATEKDSWNETITGNTAGSKSNPNKGCSWEVESRTFALSKDNGKDAKGVTELLSGNAPSSSSSSIVVSDNWSPCLK